jgi:BASS family bile acid:Na+ symporter
VLSIVFVPPALRLLGQAFGAPVYVPLRPVALVALVTVLVPLTLGMMARRLAPSLAERIAGPMTAVAMGLLVVASLPVLVTQWPPIVSLIGNGTLAALGAFVIVGLFVGHLLGGPDSDERSVLALATATRHPAIAITAAHAAFPGEKLVVPAIFSYVLLGAVLSFPYLVWRRRARQPQTAR